MFDEAWKTGTRPTLALSGWQAGGTPRSCSACRSRPAGHLELRAICGATPWSPSQCRSHMLRGPAPQRPMRGRPLGPGSSAPQSRTAGSMAGTERSPLTPLWLTSACLQVATAGRKGGGDTGWISGGVKLWGLERDGWPHQWLAHCDSVEGAQHAWWLWAGAAACAPLRSGSCPCCLSPRPLTAIKAVVASLTIQLDAPTCVSDQPGGRAGRHAHVALAGVCAAYICG